MAEHCSVELARALREAGLAHAFALGDWVWGKCGPDGVYGEPPWEGMGVVAVVTMDDDTDELRLMVAKENPPSEDCGWSAYFDPRELVWLPTSGQALEALAERTGGATCTTYRTGDEQGWCVGLPPTWRLPLYKAPSLTEVAGAALLAVLRQEGQG